MAGVDLSCLVAVDVQCQESSRQSGRKDSLLSANGRVQLNPKTDVLLGSCPSSTEPKDFGF